MGCLFSFLWNEPVKQEPLKTEAIYSLIFKDAYVNKKYERSKSDSSISYTYDKGDLIQ
jgi:hypothetical protein